MEESDPSASPWRRLPPFARLVVIVGLLFGLYQGVLLGIRAYVDHRIDGKIGSEVVEFELRDFAGDTWRALDLRGKWIVLHFFRSQCQVCIAERGAIHALEQQVDPDRVQLLGVMLDAVEGYPESMSRRTLDLLGYSHPVLWADDAFVDAFHGHGWAHVTPVTYVIDPSGRIVHALRGRQELDSLLATLPIEARKGN